LKRAPLATKKREELVRLAKMPDHRIDLSDIPEIKKLPSDASMGKFYPPKEDKRNDTA
jgi:hypothetical protein